MEQGMRYKYHVHNTNEAAIRTIELLVDENGRSPWSNTTWDIISLIAGFDRKAGCFMSYEGMSKELGGRISPRTIRRHENYLEDIGVMSKFTERTEGNKTKCTRRLVMQTQKRVPSLKQYSHSEGLYGPKNNTKGIFFLGKVRDKMSNGDGQNVKDSVTKWPPSIERDNKKENNKDNHLYPPSGISDSDPMDPMGIDGSGSYRSPPEIRGGDQGRPHHEGCRPRSTAGEYNSNPNETEKTMKVDDLVELEHFFPGLTIAKAGGKAAPGPELGVGPAPGTGHETTCVPKYQDDPGEPHVEPLLKKGRGPRKKTKQEQRAETLRMHNDGHIVSPLGPANTQLRKFDWKRAKDIGPEGAVTAAQLWRHLFIQYENAFGPGTLEPQLAQDKHAITSWFDSVRAIFVKTCGYEPTYRELSQYFTWMLDPQRLNRMGIDKVAGSRSCLKIQQLQGGVHIRSFFDHFLRHRKNDDVGTCNENIRRLGSMMDELKEIFDNIYESLEMTTSDMVLRMAHYGFPLFLQVLVERKGLSENGARKRIIETMAKFMSEASDLDAAIRYMGKATYSSEANEKFYTEATLWGDYGAKCMGLVEEAAEKARGLKTPEQKTD